MVDDQREDFGLLYAQLRNTQRVSLKQRSIWVIMSIMLIGFVASAGTIMAYYFLPNQDLLFGERKSAGSMDKLIHVEYGGDEYIIPEPFVRQVHRTVIGGVKRIEVRVPWPFWSGDRKPIFADALNRLTGSLFITFEPRPDKLEPEERITRVYYRYFAGPPVATPEGTQRYTFRSDSPYPFAELFITLYRLAHEQGQGCPHEGSWNRQDDKAGNQVINRLAIAGRVRWHSLVTQ